MDKEEKRKKKTTNKGPKKRQTWGEKNFKKIFPDSIFDDEDFYTEDPIIMEDEK